MATTKRSRDSATPNPSPTSTATGPLTGSSGKEVAEQTLRDAITRGDLTPGYRLVESEISERCSVTRNSARLALDALIAEGLVERIPNRGACVRRVSPQEAMAIMECRMVLDGLMSAKAAEHATPDEKLALSQNLDLMRDAVAHSDLPKYSTLIQEHHTLVRRAARQATAAGLVEKLNAQIVRHQFQLSLRPERAPRSLGELEAVVAAITSGRVNEAEAAARAHLAGVIDTLRLESGQLGTP